MAANLTCWRHFMNSAAGPSLLILPLPLPLPLPLLKGLLMIVMMGITFWTEPQEPFANKLQVRSDDYSILKFILVFSFCLSGCIKKSLSVVYLHCILSTLYSCFKDSLLFVCLSVCLSVSSTALYRTFLVVFLKPFISVMLRNVHHAAFLSHFLSNQSFASSIWTWLRSCVV